MPKAGRKTVLLLVIFTSFLALATANDLVYNISGDTEYQSSQKFLYENQSSLNNPYLNIENPRGKESNFTLQANDSKLLTNVSASIFDMKGVYKFDFYSDQGKLSVPGNQTIILGSANKTWNDRLAQLASNDSANRCDSGDYVCFDEYYQSKTIISATQAFRVTDNQDYLKRALNYSLADWSQAQQYACSNYECGDFDGFNTSASMRQGLAIYSLWNVYSVTGDSQVHSKAVNYTEGSPDECDVWNGGFDCGNATNQAYMMKGFWKAYEVTGDSSYRQKAVNITEEAFNESYNSSEMVSALATAYQASGNLTYRNKAFEYYSDNRNNCSSGCDEYKKLENIKSGLEIYKTTGNHYFYRNPVNNVSNLSLECLKSASSNCTYPDQQSDAAQVSALMYSAYKNQSDAFVNPVIQDLPSRNGTLALKSGMKGSPSNPELKVYDANNILEDKCSLNNFNNSCEIDFSKFEQGVYTLKLNSTENNYERQIPLTYSQRDITVEQELTNLTRSSPQEPCDPWNNSYSCVKDDIRYQSYYIQSFEDLSRSYQNRTYDSILGSLSKPSYNYTDGLATCLPASGDFSCANLNGINASQKQGSIIEALFESYQSTDNPKTFELAENYSSTSSEDGCRVWKDEYTCQSPEAQGKMIQGYWEAYEVTGNKSYKNISLELVNNSEFNRAASELARAFWETYTWTNNTQHKEKAYNLTRNITNTSDCPSCGNENFLDQGSMLVEAYQTTGNNTLLSQLEGYADNLTNICKTGSCSTPLIQGKAISFSSNAMNTVPVDIDIETDINISRSTIKVDEKTNVTCSITNTKEDTSTSQIDISIIPDESFNESEMNTTSQSLSYDQEANFTRNITGVTSGDGVVECQYSSTDFTVDDSSTITIEKEEKEDGGSDNSTGDDTTDFGEEDGSGVFIRNKDEVRNLTIVYNSTSDIQWNRTLLEQLGINTTYRNYSQRPECFTPVRKMRGDNTTLEVQSNCSADGAVLIDRITSNTSLKTGRAVKGLAVVRSSDLNERTELGIEYRGKNTTAFSRPLVLTSNYTLPPLEMVDIGSQRDGSSALISADLNKEASCSVYNQGKEVYTEETDNLVFQPSLDYGNATYRVECGDQSFTRTFTRERPQTQKEPQQDSGSIPVSWGIGALILAIIGLGLRYREEIINETEMKIFEYRFNRFETAVEQGNTAEAIEAFDSMSRDISQEVLESDMDLMQGLMLYLLIDLVEEGKDDEVSFDVSDDLDELVQRYVGNSDGKAVRLVREKYEEATGREI